MDDLISRKELLSKTIYNPLHVPYITKQDVEGMPSVQPEPKRGEWLTHYDALTGNMEVRCSFCHAKSSINLNLLMDNRTRVELFKYCPCCGARTEGDEE